MATNPGLLTEWPWKKLGNYKYGLLAPFLAHSVVTNMRRKEEGEAVDIFNLCIIPVQLLRVLHAQLWISLARLQTARSKHRIVNKSLEFEQVDRERNWDDQIILSSLIIYSIYGLLPILDNLPWWDTKGVLFTVLLHVGPVEFLYYWLHRALHHHFLYSRYHSHHHASIVTEPITAVIHPFAEELSYFVLFAIPLLTIAFNGMGNIAAIFGYLFYIDFMNYLGHCNFEIVPKWMFNIFPPLKYLMYTPSFHSLHHTQFRTNYSLFMPFYDYVYGTVDKSTDDLYEHTVKGKEEAPHVVHLTHPTTLLSIYHLRLGFASLASRPYGSMIPYAWLMWPMTFWSLLLTWTCGSAFTVERNRLGKLVLQTWAVPRYGFQYLLSWERHMVNDLIERAILDAEQKGTKVISLGLMNQGEKLNMNGEVYLQKHPKLKIRIVDGSSLAVAAILNNIPQGTRQVILRGTISKVAFLVAEALCKKEVQIITIHRADFEALKLHLPGNISNNLVLSNNHSTTKVWLVDEGLTDEEQKKAARGTIFIPYSQFPPKRYCKECFYHSTPAMAIPKSFENMHSCENWLPRRVMSAWRVAGIVHAMEGWTTHEVGNVVHDVDKAWLAALSHGFLPVTTHVD